ncbi:MAG: phytanoyl-CoA dioxygenase [Alphaproteobacteria bacterium]|nr:phytanoyl-CoA dioxygenase [Alphaproteobacteria bacterium]
MVRDLTQAERQTFASDGVALVRDAVDCEWVTRMMAVVDRQLAAPSKWSNDANPDGAENRNFTDRYLWQENAEINAFIRESGCAKLAAQAMDSQSARFYFDHLLVKEPGTASPTPWHQDIPYWPFMGKQICSLWLALTPCSVENSSLEFVRGSHGDGKYYAPEAFNGPQDDNASWMAKATGEKCPDIEADRQSFDIVGYDVEAGDALIFSAWTIHGARGNHSLKTRRAAISTRWLGDDAVWYPHAGTDPTVQQEDVSVAPGEPPVDEAVFPELWRA